MSSVSSGRIPEDFIESVLAKTDIISLIQESVKLKKQGVNYSACCPFHAEKTPSFTVSAAKQFYHCFGCGAHGDAIRFLTDHQGLTFIDALEKLAGRLGMAVPRDPQQQARVQTRSKMGSVLNRVADLYSTGLKHHPQAGGAVNYLKQRGLTGQIAKTFAIGFAPPGWDYLLKHFEKDSEALSVLEETGMIIRHPDGRFYDRFRDRIMFPIRHRKGEVIGFGARVMDQSLPKYLNSPESTLFQKGQTLYGLYEALTVNNANNIHSAKYKWERAILVEGYMDVVALSQHGVLGAIATLGTAITDAHLSQLFQFVPEIVFCFDGDKAGMAASWKALELTLGQLTEGRQVRFAFLPVGQDPDSYIRVAGVGGFELLIKNSLSLSEYFFNTLQSRVTPDTVDNRARLASQARPLIERIPNSIFKEMMFEQLAQIVGSSAQVMQGGKANRHFYRPAKGLYVPKTPLAPAPIPFEFGYMITALLLQKPELYAEIIDKTALLRLVAGPGMNLFLILLGCLSQDPKVSLESMRAALQTAPVADLKRLQESEKKVELLPRAGLQAEFCGAISRLEVLGRTTGMEILLKKAKLGPLTEAEKQQLKEFLEFKESIG